MRLNTSGHPVRTVAKRMQEILLSQIIEGPASKQMGSPALSAKQALLVFECSLHSGFDTYRLCCGIICCHLGKRLGRCKFVRPILRIESACQLEKRNKKSENILPHTNYRTATQNRSTHTTHTGWVLLNPPKRVETTHLDQPTGSKQVTKIVALERSFEQSMYLHNEQVTHT